MKEFGRKYQAVNWISLLFFDRNLNYFSHSLHFSKCIQTAVLITLSPTEALWLQLRNIWNIQSNNSFTAFLALSVICLVCSVGRATGCCLLRPRAASFFIPIRWFILFENDWLINTGTFIYFYLFIPIHSACQNWPNWRWIPPSLASGTRWGEIDGQQTHATPPPITSRNVTALAAGIWQRRFHGIGPGCLSVRLSTSPVQSVLWRDRSNADKS